MSAEPLGTAQEPAVDVTEPSEREQNLGCIAGGLFAATSLGGGASLTLLHEPARTVVGLIIGVPWLIAGVWWLALFLRRTARSYKAGAAGDDR
ncbi:hypothetical protein BH10ACT1_BH10ACT1_24060 [soil metagenome]